MCQGCIHLHYICLSCVSGVHLTLHLFCRCTTEVVLMQQGVLLGSLWEIMLNSLSYLSSRTKSLQQNDGPLGRLLRYMQTTLVSVIREQGAYTVDRLNPYAWRYKNVPPEGENFKLHLFVAVFNYKQPISYLLYPQISMIILFTVCFFFTV